MKERFLEIKKNVTKRVDSLLRCALDIPPSYEEVLTNFVHGKNCSKSVPLRKIEFEQIINIPNGGIDGISMHGVAVTQKYLECDECKSSMRYSG